MVVGSVETVMLSVAMDCVLVEEYEIKKYERDNFIYIDNYLQGKFSNKINVFTVGNTIISRKPTNQL